MRLKIAGATAVAALLALTGCAAAEDAADNDDGTTVVDENNDATDPGTVVDIADRTDALQNFVFAVANADLVDTLADDGPFTVFAPTNEAFDALPDGLIEALLLEENKDVLIKIVLYHVVVGEVTSDMLTAGDVETFLDPTVAVETEGGVTVNGANVTTADVDASNGVIHVIDQVLVPPTVNVGALL